MSDPLDHGSPRDVGGPVESMAPQAASDATPLVTVLIPVHNGARTLGAAARSAFAQQYPALEFLLLDDGSRDDSPAIGQALVTEDARARWASNGRNLGLAATLNRGFSLAHGALVLVLHQDCALDGTDWIARAVTLLRDPSVLVVSGSARHDVARMGRREKEFWIVRQHVATASEARRGSVDATPLFSENKCDLFRRAELLALGGFDERLREGGEDQVLAWRLASSRWRVDFRSDLTYTITLAQDERLSPHLRREASYGRQMRQILSITRGGAVRRSPGGRSDPRLTNRVAAILWILVSLGGLVALAVTQEPWLLVFVLGPPAVRWVQLAARAGSVKAEYRLSEYEVAATAGVGLLADLAYAWGTVSPAPRSARAPSEAAPGPPPAS